MTPSALGVEPAARARRGYRELDYPLIAAYILTTCITGL